MRCLLLLFLSKWGQCSVILMDMSPALTGLPETYKPVTAAPVNHYPATLYLVHICRFTGLWNVFSERHWSNSAPIKLKCWAASCAEADRPQSNSIIKSDKWQSTTADKKMKRKAVWGSGLTSLLFTYLTNSPIRIITGMEVGKRIILTILTSQCRVVAAVE